MRLPAPCLPPQLTGFAMPLQDALTGAGIFNLPYGPFPLPVPLVTVVGVPLSLPPFSGEGGCSRVGRVVTGPALCKSMSACAAGKRAKL